MIELNLLPDVKLEYIKAQRSRRLVAAVSLLISVAAIALLALILAANGLQKKHLNDLTRDIGTESRQLQQQPQINKILTVQNQLKSLTGLHDSKPAAPRLFDYLNQVTPAQVNITDLLVDYTKQTATITGTADALSNVNKYADTLKFTTYNPGDNSSAKAFSNVVLSNFSLSSDNTTGRPANYTINLVYDKNIFDITKSVKLSVPNLTTTRSALEKPTDLFQAVPAAVNPVNPKGSQ
jgi:hypothetical protein